MARFIQSRERQLYWIYPGESVSRPNYSVNIDAVISIQKSYVDAKYAAIQFISPLGNRYWAYRSDKDRDADYELLITNQFDKLTKQHG